MQNWTPLIFVLLAIALAVGPIMMMQPTKTQQRLAKLRDDARKMGLMVTMCVWPSKFKVKVNSYMRYQQPWHTQHPPKCTFFLFKQGYEHDLHLAKTWEKVEAINLPEEKLTGLLLNNEILENIASIGCTTQGVFVDWNENNSTKLEGVREFLEQLREVLISIK